MISHTHLTHHTYHVIAGECGEEKREGEGEGEGEGGGGKSRAEQSRAEQDGSRSGWAGKQKHDQHAVCEGKYEERKWRWTRERIWSWAGEWVCKWQWARCHEWSAFVQRSEAMQT